MYLWGLTLGRCLSFFRSSAHADPHAAGHLQHPMSLRDQAALSGHILQPVLPHMVVLHGHRDAVVPVLHHLGGIGPKLGGQHPVIGTGAPAPLHVAGDTDPGLDPGEGLDLPGNAVV